MRVQDLMTPAPTTCHIQDSAQCAARIMWEQDCGIVPIEDDTRRIVGVVTDRDIAMAAHLQGLALSQIPVESCMTHGLYVCRPEDDVSKAERLMSERQVHRIPVVDGRGQLVGILSTGDIARRCARHMSMRGVNDLAEDLVQTIAAITRPRGK